MSHAMPRGKRGELLPRENLGAKMSNWILETLTGILMVDCNKGKEKYAVDDDAT
jgi:hypothetical protein